MTKQVYLYAYGFWVDVSGEDDKFIYAVDVDGINVWIIKDGTEQTRWPK